ncbi:MAG: lamin tail domain-containing protein [Deltaproteobacteria bacterium]|nr:lamin tail domain-containing protein [Deltaproteobacteria bacterium]
MEIQIVEIHPGADKKKLNTEWFMVENRGDKPFSTRNCTLSVHKGKGKPSALGTIDPGFTLAPGERVRVLTGTPGKKSHGKPPEDGETNYSLFLGAPILRGPGSVLTLALRTHTVCSATFDPKGERGVRAD